VIKSRRMRQVKHVARIGDTKNDAAGKPEGKRQLEKPRRR
jgi:hypothetical protein